jgi:hypothetical protein
MNFDQTRFAAVLAAAKAKAADSPHWLRAIERAAEVLASGELIVTLLHNGALLTSPNGSYHVNGRCGCKAVLSGHAECYHRAAVRMVEMMETASVVSVRVPRIIHSIESDHTGARYTVTRCDGWHI